MFHCAPDHWPGWFNSLNWWRDPVLSLIIDQYYIYNGGRAGQALVKHVHETILQSIKAAILSVATLFVVAMAGRIQQDWVVGVAGFVVRALPMVTRQ